MLDLQIRNWWAAHDTAVIRLASVLMAISAAVWLVYECWRLVWEPGYWGAIDLRVLRVQVVGWLSGVDIYRKAANALYPPASYLLLWPLVGWLALAPLRWFWLITTVPVLSWLIYLAVRASGAETARERMFIALIPLSMYATGATIGNGQLTLHVLPPLITGILLLQKTSSAWWDDLLPAALFLFSLVKPTISVPFFWIVLFRPGRLRPASLVAIGYLLLFLLAVSFQQSSPLVLAREWLDSGSMIAAGSGTADLSIWLSTLGLGEMTITAALIVLLLLGGWVWLHRQDDVWILLGVTGVIARLWIYHLWYDDLLLLLPMIALYRLARRGKLAGGMSLLAGGLLAALIALMIAPGGLYLLPSPWNSVYQAFQVAAWLAALVFFLAVSSTTGNPKMITRSDQLPRAGENAAS